MVEVSDLHARALRHYAAGQAREAEQACLALLQTEPLHAGAVHLLGVLLLDAGAAARAIPPLHHATLLRPDNAAFHHALGEAWRLWGGPRQAAACYGEALRLDPKLAAAHNSLGLVRMDQGDLTAAADCFRRALAARPDYERAHNNLGRVLQVQGDAAGAIASFAEAVRLKSDYAVARNNLGAALQGQGRHAEAVTHFREALARQPAYPEAHHNLASSLHALGDAAAARGHFSDALRLRPDYAHAHHGLARALETLGDLPAALTHLREAVRLKPDFARAHESLGDLLLLQPDWQGARAAFERVLELQPDNAEAFSRLAYTRQVLCDWRTWPDDLKRLGADLDRRLAEGKPAAIVPFCALTLPWDGARQLAVAQSHSRDISHNAEAVRPTLGLSHPPPAVHLPPGGRLRIGYLSAEFRDHAVSHLTQAVYGLHDRRRFEVFGYSFGPDDGSSYRKKIAKDCDHFIDLAAASLTDGARRIHADGVHVLVDLQGYIGFPRLGMLALRPAPVQAHWLGYPGSLGADFIDYLIGDPATTPPQSAADFGEKLVTLPHTYLATDRDQPISGDTVTRAGCGLPEKGVVFCAFNNRYKIEPTVYDVWMRVMRQVPDGVLWLSPAPPVAEQNLRREAEARGVNGSRLVFARHVAGKADHLARHRAADLFLDTLYYNGHTTACDALWAGLPVLTCPGPTFASRVGASLLRAVGLPELIASSLEEYEQMAIRIAAHPGELRRLRDKLAAHRTTQPLFDTPRLVRNLERAYRAMWDVYATGQPPRPVVVKEELP